MTIEELKIIIEAETKGLKTELKKVQSQLETVNKSATKTQGTFKKLFTGLKTGVAIAALTKFAKSALEAASNVEEVQNVIEVAFGESTEAIEEFSIRALSAFGLTEYGAKKAASTYMLMAGNMGLAADDAETMALQLTALTGDLSSLYNISHDVAQTALSSIFTGETESLKKLGIVMTEVNLEQFAMEQGIKKSYSEMTQAEKTVLRYNFVLSKAAVAQGDFSRTSSSWANQMRVLNGQWQKFKSVIGEILSNTLLPMVQVLSKILGLIIAVAESFAKVFGKKETQIEIEARGAQEVEQGLGAGANYSKEIKKNLVGFDELNNLSADSGSSGGGGYDASIDLGLNPDELYNIDEIIQTSVDDGKKILQDFFLWIEDNWWKMLLVLGGILIGFNFLDLFVGGFGDIDWSSALGFGGLLENAGILGYQFLEMFKLTSFGEIGELIIGAITTPFKTIGSIITPILKGLGSTISTIFSFILTPVGSVVAAFVIIGAALYDLWNNCEWFRDGLTDLWENTLQPIIEGWGDAWDELMEEHLKPMFDKLTGEDGFISGLMDLVSALWDILVGLWDFVAMVIGILTITLIPILVGIGDILMAVLIPVIGWIIDIISGVIDILNGVITFLVGVFTGDWEKAWDGVAMIFEGIWNTLVAIFKGIINFFIDIINGAINAIGSVVSTVVDVVNSFNIKIPDWVPLIGGEKLGFYLKKPNIPQIPHLADGGLAYGQTLAMIGEYDGANNNPEVIAPLSKLENMMNVDLLAQKLDKLIAVVDSKEFNAYISQRDVGKAAINYINGQSRILGGSVI